MAQFYANMEVQPSRFSGPHYGISVYCITPFSKIKYQMGSTIKQKFIAP